MSRTQEFTPRAVVNIANAGVPQQLSPTRHFVKSLMISALPTNTDFLYVGDATTRTIPLQPGQFIAINADALDVGGGGKFDLSTVWIDALVSGEGFSWAYMEGI